MNTSKSILQKAIRIGDKPLRLYFARSFVDPTVQPVFGIEQQITRSLPLADQ